MRSLHKAKLASHLTGYLFIVNRSSCLLDDLSPLLLGDGVRHIKVCLVKLLQGKV